MISSADPIVVLGGARTPIGSFGGSLSGVPAHELGAIAVKAALARAGVAPGAVDEVVMGCCGQVAGDAYNARRVALSAGLADTTPAFTVNRLCGSGVQAVWSAAQELATGAADVVVAGGDENMSRLPFLDFGARDGYRLGHRALLDGTLAVLTDPFSNVPMGATAEAVAQHYDVSRAAQDEFAAESQRRAATAEAKAAYAEEIVAVEIGGRKPKTVTTDEHPKPATTVETLATLRPAFDKAGTVTAGNSSGINDGAAGLVLTRASTAAELGLTPLASIVEVTVAAIEPRLLGYAPTFAIRSLLEREGLGVADLDSVELNEAFAAQAVAVARDLGLDPAKTNPYGGAIALGHPVGATGAILTVRIVLDLIRRDLTQGVVSLCIGGGQGIAMLVRRWGA